MTVRHFAGTAFSDFVVFDAGNLAGFDGGPGTFAVVWRAHTVSAAMGLFRAYAGGGTGLWAVNPFSDGTTYFATSPSAFVQGPAYSTGWLLTAYTKAAGSSAVRSHQLDLGTGAWSHAAEGTIGDAAAAVATVEVGRFNAGEVLDGDIAALAFFDVEMDDATVEATLGSAAADWLAAGPLAMWMFDQASTSDPVLDLTGGGADQTSVSGTAVLTGDDPPNFDLSLAGTRRPGPATVLQAVSRTGAF